MKFSAASALLAVAGIASATYPNSINPFVGKNFFVGSNYANELKETVAAFTARGDTLNAARARTIQSTSTFVWVTTVAQLPNLNATIEEARAVHKKTRKRQVVQFVLYNLPDRDCSAGDSAGEFSLAKNGLERYKNEYIDEWAYALGAARDLTFVVVLEPDSLGNAVTNQNVPFCQTATPGYEEGIAYAIAKLQLPNVALYIDAAHGGWLGWDGNLPLAAAVFSKVVKLAKKFARPHSTPKIRGFCTNVSNYNPYIANPRANYTQYSNSYDELRYAESLAPHLVNASLPARFIIDQGRSGLQNQRAQWGDWCNQVAGYGIMPTVVTNSSLVDAIVWVKPAGESDGQCGPLVNGVAAPGAGKWFEEYAEQTIINADPPIKPTY